MISATITGRLGADPTVRNTDSGTVMELSIASQHARDKDACTWVRASMWGDRGAKLAAYLAKGDRVCVSGTMELRSYTKDSAERWSLDMRVNEIDLISDRRHDTASPEDDGRAPPPQRQAPPQRPAPPPTREPPQQQQPARTGRAPW